MTGNGSGAIDLSTFPTFDTLCIGAAPGSNYTVNGFTPVGNTYYLGGGGGTLTVSTILADSWVPRRAIIRGNVTLTGVNTYTGGTTIHAGNLTFAEAEDIPPGTSNILIDSGGALDVAGAHSSVGDWLSSGKIDPNSTGALALTGNGPGAIDLSSFPTFDTLCIGAAPGSNYTVNGFTPVGDTYYLGGGGGTLTVSAILADSVAPQSAVISGNVTLTEANTYTGGTTITRRHTPPFRWQQPPRDQRQHYCRRRHS